MQALLGQEPTSEQPLPHATHPNAGRRLAPLQHLQHLKVRGWVWRRGRAAATDCSCLLAALGRRRLRCLLCCLLAACCRSVINQAAGG